MPLIVNDSFARCSCCCRLASTVDAGNAGVSHKADAAKLGTAYYTHAVAVRVLNGVELDAKPRQDFGLHHQQLGILDLGCDLAAWQSSVNMLVVSAKVIVSGVLAIGLLRSCWILSKIED